MAGAPVVLAVPPGPLPTGPGISDTPDPVGAGSVTVLVNNALTGAPIPGATVVSEVGSQTTDANGTTTFANVPAGVDVVFSAGAPGLVTAQSTTTPVANGSVQITISLSEPVAGARIVLNWGGNPRDLDSHLTGPDGGAGRFHVFFANRDAGGASLDRDDTDGSGPETITVSQARPGLYRYSVHHFSGTETICSTASQISVSVVVGAQQALTFQPPTSGCVGGASNVWVVFEFDGVSVNPINQFYSSSAGNVRGTASGSEDDDAALLRALPPKQVGAGHDG
jgi:hypothetical protein